MATKREVVIKKANMVTDVFTIVGKAPYVQNCFSNKAEVQIRTDQERGSQKRKGSARVARDFEADYLGSMHVSREGWRGIPASAFRNAMIDACRLVGFKMTVGKISIFIEHDGLNQRGNPLVKIKGEPKIHVDYVRLPNGTVNLASRAMWDEWGADIAITYDADQFSLEDIANLLDRAGLQVGIGEGRPFSKKSNGCGWGVFRVLSN